MQREKEGLSARDSSQFWRLSDPFAGRVIASLVQGRGTSVGSRGSLFFYETQGRTPPQSGIEGQKASGRFNLRSTLLKSSDGKGARSIGKKAQQTPPSDNQADALKEYESLFTVALCDQR